MIKNLIDRRTRHFGFAMLDAVAEVPVDDRHTLRLQTDDEAQAERRQFVTLEEAISWAGQIDGEVTLYLDDLDSLPEEAEPQAGYLPN